MRKIPMLAAGALAAATLALAGCSSDSGDSPAASGSAKPATSNDPTELVLALVPSQDQDSLVDTAKPLTDYLSEQIGIPVTGVVSKDYQAAVEAMGAGQAQIGFLPSTQLLQAQDMYDAHIVLQTARNGAVSYAGQFMTNNPDTYCDDTPVDVDGLLYCNGTDDNGQGPAGLDSISKLKDGVKVAVLGAGSPAGYQYPMVALMDAGVDPAKDIQQVPVTANDASVLAVYNGDAEVGFSFWDARKIVSADEAPDLGQKVVVFALTSMIPNDGVALSDDLSPELRQKITDALDHFADTPEGAEALQAIYSITDLAPADLDALNGSRAVTEKLGLS